MDPLLRHIHPLDSLEAEQELDLVDGRLGGHLLQDRAEGLLHILAERDALDDEAGQVYGHPLIRLKHDSLLGQPPTLFLHGIPSRETDVAAPGNVGTIGRRRRSLGQPRFLRVRRSMAPGRWRGSSPRGKIWAFCTFWVPVVGRRSTKRTQPGALK